MTIGLSVAGGVLILATVGLAVLSLTASRPDNLGVRNGRLTPCPGTPNCVSSQAADSAEAIDPLNFTGDSATAFALLKTIVEQSPRSHLVTASDDYLHAEFTSRLFRFTDDVEFLLDRDNGVIHVRSASRVGRSDLGANRRRIEDLRQQFQQASATRG